MSHAASFLAGFLTFPIVMVAILGKFAWRHIKDVTRW